MKIDATKPATAGTVVGWLFLALAIAVWLVVIPLTGSALFFATRITAEPSFATIGTVVYGIVGAIGFTAVAATEHRSSRPALWIYLALLSLATIVAVALNLKF
ncbi:hypothetical protein QFW96_23855 [Saccharopolyspora sp. TS4A08]|uniref:Uncharacterized protein n=1 Tax=Saccharopolyspora ipomoeae TaxID=3042027 RepID=A0ABT6PUJ1_9PSEU|nr:hypothetical protein [Saccharopolyspora sp. TS4A08]MDI2031684.1 hypothetical protein [Saccharopolyspora sp. TS4A08]